jgi:putative (di)nucleoside polyphosphate hydrolase
MSKTTKDLKYRPNAGVMLVNQDGLIFAGQRLDSGTEAPAWQMPQGGIDKGEEPRAAALRELTEETGIDAKHVVIEAEAPDWLSYDFPEHIRKKVGRGKYCGQTQRWFLMRFNGTDTDVNIDTDEPEFGAWKWISPDELIASIVPFKRDIYTQVIETFRDKL